MTKVFVFGNEDLKEDSLPFRILPKLQEKFPTCAGRPNIQFEIKDPNEEWEVTSQITSHLTSDLIVLDTVVGIKEVTVFDNLDKFSKVPNISMHDFDALTNLRYLQKLGKIKKVEIIALPVSMEESEALQKVTEVLENIKG